MRYRLIPALALMFVFGCAATQAQPVTPEEFTIRRSAVREGTYMYATGAAGVNERCLNVLDDSDSYYQDRLSDRPGSVAFTITLHPDTVALASFYERMPVGVEIRVESFILGGGDSVCPLRGRIAFDTISWPIRRGAPEESFSFEAPSGIRAGFEIRILELSDGDTGVPRYEATEATPCPSGFAFTAVLAHEDFNSPDAVVRYVGRSGQLKCRYTIDLIEGSPFPPRATAVAD